MCVYVFVWRSRLDGWKNHFASGGLTDGEVCAAYFFFLMWCGENERFFMGRNYLLLCEKGRKNLLFSVV